MDEIVKLVVERTGISEDLAQKAVETVVSYLKDKLPEPLSGQIEGLLEGSDLGGQAGDLLKGLGGFLGKR